MVSRDFPSATRAGASRPDRAGKGLKVRDLGDSGLARRLSGEGLRLRTGPVVTCIRSPLDDLAQGVALLYAEHGVEDDGFADFHVLIDRPQGLRRWWRPQVIFQFDGAPPFHPLPGGQSFPILEWGLNWCVSSHCNQYLIVHAAVLARHGRALLMPAPPGSGKSTLCAALAASGWRLLSDELTLISPSSGEVLPLARPISLKNASIDVIRRFAPDARIGPTVHDTLKGSVAHMQPPAESVRRDSEPAKPGWIILPRYVPDAPALLEPLPKAHAFMQLADNAFNYDLHGARGFALLGDLIGGCDCYHFSYGRLEEAIQVFEGLA